MTNSLFNSVFKDKRILITGHTGFKGSWLSLIMNRLGSDVYGFALEPPTNPNLYTVARINDLVTSNIGDIRDYGHLFRIIKSVKPEIIIHLAAQPIVRESYLNPIETYATNVMGTVNLFEAVRNTTGVKVVLNVTTDKCYENREWHWGYRENEPLGGHDPYSSSKGCSELISSSFRNSFFNSKEYNKHGVTIATARAGNVIGGGDWAADRLIPDIIRAITKGDSPVIRNPYSTRPWQHVMEPLSGYLTLVAKLFIQGPRYAEAWNFGPNDTDARNVEWVTKTLCRLWDKNTTYTIDNALHPHEATYLKLDCSKAKSELGWNPKWDIGIALQAIVDWHKAYEANEDIRSVTEEQIESYFSN